MPKSEDLGLSLTRRDFARVAAGTTAYTVMSSTTALGSRANSAVAVGIIGCGWRGNHLMGLLKLDDSVNVRVAAIADLFDDKLEETRVAYAENPRPYKGFTAYQELVAGPCDAVLITSPPYFHPEHLEAAVAAGKHVYLEKPVAVDPPGASKVMNAGEVATKKKLTLMVGFQSRDRQDLREGIERVRSGAIGRIVCGNAYYNAGGMEPKAKAGVSEKERRLRNWVFDKVLSGDIIVEQNIHVIDICNWTMGKHPVKAFATSAQSVRTSVGDTSDHYEATFWYPDGGALVFSSTQFLDLGWGDAQQKFYGPGGAFEAKAGDTLKGSAAIRGERPWEFKGDIENPEILRLQTFVTSIREGKAVNEAASGAESTLTSVLARTAAQRSRPVTWQEMLEENEKLDARL